MINENDRIVQHLRREQRRGEFRRNFRLFGVDGLIPYDPEWRQAKIFAEFEPQSLGVRPLTVAEIKAFKARETNIEFITGKPGGGKSMTAVKVIVDELLHGDRPIVTNLALDLARLQEYIHELGGTVCVAERVRLLTHEEVFKFYTIRGHLVVVDEPSHGHEVFDFTASQMHPESAGGVFYVIDECHNYFSTKAKIEEDSPMFKWASQHRKLKDYCYFVTQSIENVNAKVRRLGQQFNYIRNLRKETFRGFRRGDGFERTAYLHIPTGEGSVPIHRETFKLDTSGLASCYYSAGGVGVKPIGNADGGFQKKGLHVRWIWAAFAVGVVLLASLCFIIPGLLGKGAQALLTDPAGEKKPSEPVRDVVVSPPQENKPVTVRSPEPGPVTDRAPLPLSDVFATGYVHGRGMITISMSDGTTRTERDRELQRVERNSITLAGEKIFIRPIPRRDVGGFGGSPPSFASNDFSAGASLPPPPASAQPAWQLHSDGVARLVRPSSGPGR